MIKIPHMTRLMYSNFLAQRAAIKSAFEEADVEAEDAFQKYSNFSVVQPASNGEQWFVEILMGAPDLDLRTCLAGDAKPVKLGWYILPRFNRVGTVASMAAHRQARLAVQKKLQAQLGTAAVFEINCSGPHLSVPKGVTQSAVYRAKIALRHRQIPARDDSKVYNSYAPDFYAPPVRMRGYLDTLRAKEAA